MLSFGHSIPACIFFSFQAVSKVKNALHGKQNNRWSDLEMMTRFAHTGRCTLQNKIVNKTQDRLTIHFKGEIENFNSLTNKYCPKMYSYR